MKVAFKKCEFNDCLKLAELSRITFIEAFEKDNEPDDFKTDIEQAFNIDTIKEQLKNDGCTFYFIVFDTVHVGYFKLNTKNVQTEQFEANTMELERLYVLKEFQGKEIGRKALVKTIELAKEGNVDFLWLGVWERNLAAIRFYERHGFKKFGTHPYMLGNDKQTDWLMKYAL